MRSLKQWVLGLFRAGFGAPRVEPPAPPPPPAEAVPAAPELPAPALDTAVPAPAKKARKRRKKRWTEVSAWHARLRSPEVDE